MVLIYSLAELGEKLRIFDHIHLAPRLVGWGDAERVPLALGSSGIYWPLLLVLA